MKVKISRVGTPEDHKKNFEVVGNLPFLWVDSVLNLLMSSAALRANMNNEVHEARLEDEHFPPITRVFWPMLMLRAFALECLLKAIWLNQGKLLCREGKYVGVPHAEGHNLHRLAEAAQISVTPDEEHVLKSLSHAAKVAGRYPISKNIPPGKITAESWSSPTDERLFRQFLKKIWPRAGSPLPVNGLLDRC